MGPLAPNLHAAAGHVSGSVVSTRVSVWRHRSLVPPATWSRSHLIVYGGAALGWRHLTGVTLEQQIAVNELTRVGRGWDLSMHDRGIRIQGLGYSGQLLAAAYSPCSVF